MTNSTDTNTVAPVVTSVPNPRPVFNMEKADALMAASATKKEAKVTKKTKAVRPVSKAKNLQPVSHLDELSTGLRLLMNVAPTFDKYKLSLYRGQLRVSFESNTALAVFEAMSDTDKATLATAGFEIESKSGEYFFKTV